jgi:adenylate cyclase
VHLGEVVYGNIGSRGRLDFTVMGPAVNLTSRLEAMTKEVGFPIVVSQAFAAACRSTPLDPTAPDGGLGMEVADLGALALRGVSRPVEAWGVRPRPPV